MPYKVIGKKLLHYKSGHWSVKQTAHNHDNAVKAMHLLEGIKHGWHPTHDGASKNYSEKESVDGTLGGLLAKRKKSCKACETGYCCVHR